MRQTIRKAALKESQQFLNAIGTAEMEQEIKRRVVSFSEKTKTMMENEPGISTSIDDEDIKRYLDEVLIELKLKKEGIQVAELYDFPSNCISFVLCCYSVGDHTLWLE